MRNRYKFKHIRRIKWPPTISIASPCVRKRASTSLWVSIMQVVQELDGRTMPQLTLARVQRFSLTHLEAQSSRCQRPHESSWPRESSIKRCHQDQSCRNRTQDLHLFLARWILLCATLSPSLAVERWLILLHAQPLIVIAVSTLYEWRTVLDHPWIAHLIQGRPLLWVPMWPQQVRCLSQAQLDHTWTPSPLKM